VATVRRLHEPYGEETAMDTTVTGIGSVVVARSCAAGYMESTIGQHDKTIKALTGFAEEHGQGPCVKPPTGLHLRKRKAIGNTAAPTALSRCRVRVDDGQSAHWPSQCAAQVRLQFRRHDSEMRSSFANSATGLVF
jgi:hypothetical protein